VGFIARGEGTIMKETIIQWSKYNAEFPKRNFGWYLVILKPVNFKECELNGLDYADWIASYGFEKAWYNNHKFYIANPHGYRTEEVTDRVELFAELPKVAIKNSCKVEMQS